MKDYYEESSKTICEYIYNDYIDGMDLMETDKIVKSLPLLIENNLAVKISGMDDLMNSGAYTYRYACKFIQKYNKAIKHHRRELLKWEFGGSENTFAKHDKKLIDLTKYSLENGSYYAQIGESDYCVLILKSEDDDPYYVKYELYFIGEKCRKWKKKFTEVLEEYKELKKNETNEMILYTDGRPGSSAIFKPFDKVIFPNKEDVIKYIDNFIHNIPKYYEYGMTPKLSIILYGNPGTGKSTFAKALARYLNIATITSVTPDYFSDYSSNGKNNGRSIGYAETIYVLDDVDCVCKSREISQDADNAKVLANLLSFLDNPPTFQYKAHDGIKYPISIVVATTNYYDKLDDAVKRYGRFDLKIEMHDFNKEMAQKMCDIYGLKLENLVKDCDKKDFTISPSQLQALCLENIDNSMKQIN